MKILVTGGSGFLGSHVADALSEAGHDVTVFDLRASRYLRSDQKMVMGDILDRELLMKAVSGQEVVYHFAGIADIDECSRRPLDVVKYNILGTAQLLDICRDEALKRFVFASSAYVYSDYGYFYRTSKKACEDLIEDYHFLYGLKYTCLRYGSLYGHRADQWNSLYRILKQALDEGKIVYHGSGEEVREFIHVKDAAQSSVTILDAQFENQYIILTGTEKMRYMELLEMIQEMLHNNVDIEMRPANRKAHYKLTPYNFSPKLGRKMIVNPHIDMGQGILEYMAEIYASLHTEKDEGMGIFVDRNNTHARTEREHEQKRYKINWQAVFFDFDGVILDSVDVKTQAFAQMFSAYGKDVEAAVVRYHLKNGGLSRYDKFRHYYEKILKRPISNRMLEELGREFSTLVVQKVIDSPSIPGALETLQQLKQDSIPAFVVSGTPEAEIRSIVQKKGISQYFKEVHGSPRKKFEIAADILRRFSFEPDKCLFLGDALSDYEAAQYNGLHFLGIVRNNVSALFPEGTPISSRVHCTIEDYK